jgi:hypothetical protein
MHELLVVAAFLTVGLFLYWVVRAADAFGSLADADRTQAYRLAEHCGVNPHAFLDRVRASSVVLAGAQA